MLNSKFKIILLLFIFFLPIILDAVSAQDEKRVVLNRESVARELFRPSGIPVTSDPNGAEVLVDGSSKGTAPLDINGLKTGRDNTVPVNPRPFTPSHPKISIAFDPANVQPGQTSIITVTVSEENGKPVQGANVTLTSTKNGRLNQATGPTNTTGQLESKFIASSEIGDYEITANVEGSSNLAAGSNNASIVVFKAAASLPVPWLVLVVILMVLILAGAGAYLWTRNNLQVLPKEKSLLCDGKSTLPLKVQFVNGFGKVKKQGSDREVQMETTSGKIDKVVVPTGKAFAEVLLTSSNECGPVMVTARSDGQDVKVPVEFTANEVGLDLEIDKAEIPADGKNQATVSIMVKCAEGVHIMSQCERTILLETTHGEITSPVKIPPRTMTGTATLTAGDRSGTAIVTATSGLLKGDAKIIFAETEKRHCMWCGTPMKMEANKCPKCGKIPPSGVDTKQCGACNAVLPLSATFCDKCGAKQSQ
jgi:ribosomal protein L40E